ncbi:MAG: aryl-sulfate sulfotransferase [Phycisphaerales bacterium]
MNPPTSFVGALVVALAATTLVAPVSSAQITLPAESVVLNRTHVMLQWPPVAGAVRYQVQVVVDSGQQDPFNGATPVVDVTIDGAMPRTVITSGLTFGKAYAWRVRTVNDQPGRWGTTHRFSVAPLPAFIPQMVVTGGGDAMQPGLTMFDLRSGNGAFSGGLALAVDAQGTPVWFLYEAGGVGDLRLLPNGHVLFEGTNRGNEKSLEGQVFWTSPPGLLVHHEVFPMPSGNYLVLVNTSKLVNIPGGTMIWNGSRIVEFDHNTNAIVFDWNEFDHFSTLDFDAVTGGGDWTHSNAVIYNEADHSIYHSSRHLSRITRIDYPSGNIIYEMGFDMPSGDVDFGDNLFSFQHAPEMLPNGHMMLFDNGNRRDHIVQTPETGVSKAIELAFTGDPPTSASIVWEWTVPDYNFAVGDADRLPPTATRQHAGRGGNHQRHLRGRPDGTVTWSLERRAPSRSTSSTAAERISAPALPADPARSRWKMDVERAPRSRSLLSAWGPCPVGDPCSATNNDGTVGGADLGLLISTWGT